MVRCSTNIYAKMFSDAGYGTSYMQSVVHLGHILRRRGHYDSWRQGGRHEKGAWVFTPATMIPYLGRGPFHGVAAAAASYRSCFPGIAKLVRRSGQGDPDVIWTTRPGSRSLKTIFPQARFVFQVVDFYPAFGKGNVQELERSDYEAADHIFSIGHALTAYLTDDLGVAPDKITTLGQGVFTESYTTFIPVPEDMANLPGPRAIWVGVLDKGDAQLFQATAACMQRQGGSLVLIGPPAPWAQALARENPAVHLLRQKAPEAVATYLRHADIALMLYDRSRDTVYRGQNPLKLYEYAAAGLPILSTDHLEYEYLKPPVLIIRQPSEIGAAIQRALTERAAWRRATLAFAEQHSWHSLFTRAQTKIHDLLAQTANN